MADDVLQMFEGLRVADVRDGMDWVGLPNKGSVTREIRPLVEGKRMLCRAFTVRSRHLGVVIARWPRGSRTGSESPRRGRG
jgi:regulator of RNase E activity RraA